MKYEYKRPTVKINHWFVTKDNIERLHEFFKERFKSDEVSIKLETVSGNNRIYDSFHEFEEDIPKLESDSEIVSEILILDSDRSLEDDSFKQSWIKIHFKPYCEASFHLIGGDNDNSFKDWIEGTYVEINKFKELFEVDDQKIVNTLDKRNTSIVFDPDGKIRGEIEASLKLVNSKEDINPQKFEVVNNHLFWYQKPLGQIAIGVIIAVIAGIILLNL
jgi:hypothetical protein